MKTKPMTFYGTRLTDLERDLLVATEYRRRSHSAGDYRAWTAFRNLQIILRHWLREERSGHEH